MGGIVAMSSTINASTASGGGVITTADASGILQLQTAGVTGLTIDASQNVGIGTSSPVDKLQIEGNIYLGTTGRTIYQGGSADLTLQVNTGVTKFLRANGVSESMRIDSSGNLLVGTTSAVTTGSTGVMLSAGSGGTRIGVAGTGASNMIYFYNSNGIVGAIQTSGSATSYVTSSDYRLKENIIPIVGALDKVVNLNPVTYIWKGTDNEVGEGFIAHELQAICPLAVSGEKDAVNKDGSIKAQGIDPSKIVALLTAAIQELKAIIDTQNARIEALEAK